MSRKSPFTRNSTYKKEVSPLHNHYANTPSSFMDSYKNKPHSTAYNKSKNQPEDTSYNYKQTQKKNFATYELDSLLQTNKTLSKQNEELYNMLKERGQIITALEGKLEEQMKRQAKTLESIEQERNKFVKDSHRKFKDYQRKIEDLIKENYRLNDQNQQQNMIKAQQIELIKATFSKQQFIKMNQYAHIQESAREVTELQFRKTQALLKRRNHQIQELQHLYEGEEEKLKNQIIGLNNQLVHLNHIKKIQFSDQKIAYQNMIDNIKRQNAKEKELATIEHDIATKKLEKQLANKQIQVNKLGEMKKIAKIQQEAREEELIEKKDKLETQICQLEQFYKQKVFNETQQLKEENQGYISALETGNEAIISNLKNQIEKLNQIQKAKTEQINQLYNQISTQREQSSNNIKHLEKVIEELKEKMNKMEQEMNEQTQNLKIKWAQLSQADIKALKNFYERELEGLQNQLDEKTQVADGNRQKLHQELQQKNQMRKRFDLETLNLNKRISELQFQINELLMTKKQGQTSLNAAVDMTTSKLLRQTTQKQKANQTNEGEKRKLQELINAKDKQIQQLNEKIKIMKDNYSKEIAQKNAQIQIFKKHNEDLQLQLKKQKIFYQTEAKKKDSILKNEKSFHEEQVSHMKKRYKQEFDSATAELTSKINKLEVEINRLNAIEKNLKNQISSLEQQKAVTLDDKKDEIELTKTIHQNEKKVTEQRLKKYYTEQMSKLEEDIAELKKQLSYKEEDLRNKEEVIHKLEQKLDSLMKSQEQLRSLEQKVLCLGQENNIVKNLAEISQKGKK